MRNQQCKPHNETAEAVIALLRTTRNIGELLSIAHAAQRQQALRLIILSIHFLVRQGLALRVNGSDSSANLIQLLGLRAEDKPQIAEWLDRSTHKHTSPENQNETFELMAHCLLRKLWRIFILPLFLALMVDKSNMKQLTLVNGGSVKAHRL